MRSASKVGLRVAGLLAMAVFVAHCGGNDVNIHTGGVNPSAGTFHGTTGEGGDITIVVGSIEAITLDCNGTTLVENFSPPEPVDSDGSFNVTITDHGKTVHVSGTFTNNNSVDGSINDEDDDCDTTFGASRTTGGVATSTPSGGKTHTPGEVTPTTEPTPAETSTAETPAGTSTGPTPTGVTPTPSGGGTGPTPTSATSPCPSKLTLEGQGEQADLDTGTTGLAFDQKVIGKGTISVALNCTGQPGSCGACAVTGPIASTTTTNNARCTTDTSITCTCTGTGKSGDPVTCTPTTPCPGTGTCQFFFGAPLPLSSGGIGVCVVNQVVGSITGTANPDSGSGASTVLIASRVHTSQDNLKPCPRCISGTCNEGPRMGLACTVHGTSASFGNTSFDCPPNPASNVSGANGLQINLNPTTGTSSLQPDAGANKCTFQAFNGKACYCPGQKKTNDCDEDMNLCPADATGEGTCPSVADLYCTSSPFFPCLSNADCENADCNLVKPRKCAGLTDATLNIIGPLTRTGTPSKTNPVLVSTFCIAATGAAAVNNAAGLPGAGALRLPSKTCFGDVCSF